MKFAIIQNQIGVGGRSKVTAEFIRLLNEKGIVPDLFSFSAYHKLNKFKNNFGEDLLFNYNKISPISLFDRGYSYQVMLFNFIVKNKLEKYDYIFNCNDAVYFLPDTPVVINYINFPFEASLNITKRYNNFKWKLYLLPLKLILKYFKPKINHKSVLIANSQFTKKHILKTYNIYNIDNEIEVIYPPTFDYINESARKKVKVITLGSITPDKRQMDQIKIAKFFPQLEFNIVGTIKSKKYYRQCLRYIQRENLDNVTIYPNLRYNKLINLLDESLIYLHTKVNEHFGISTVEAIANGCVPVVHNSGGQKEIVPYNELRFDNLNQAIEIISNIINNNIEYHGYVAKLKKYIQQFSTNNFRSKINDLLNKLIN